MTERLLDTFVEPTLYQRFNLRKGDVLPASVKLADFTIISTTIKEREYMTLPTKSSGGMIEFKSELCVVFDEPPQGTLMAIDDTKDPTAYKNSEGYWVAGDHLHIEINNLIPGMFWFGAQWTPKIAEVLEKSITGWWWIFTLRNPIVKYPLDHIQGGYIFEKEEDAICARAALDVK